MKKPRWWAGAYNHTMSRTAASDRAMQWLAARLRWPADRMRAVLWALSVAGATYLFKR